MIPRTEVQALLRKIERRRQVAECKQRRAAITKALLSGMPYLEAQKRWRGFPTILRRVYGELRAAGALGVRFRSPKRPLRRPPIYRLPEGMTVVNKRVYRVRERADTYNQ